jgi:heme/copper-type cytochrome/quinol oxidase subunit 2
LPGEKVLQETKLIAPLLLIFLFVFVANASEPQPDISASVKSIEIRIEGRQVVGDSNVFRVDQGTQIELVVTTDEAASLHLHGYDIEFAVTPEEPATVSLTAHATGRYPVTSHGWGGGHEHGHQTLFYLEVYPQ